MATIKDMTTEYKGFFIFYPETGSQLDRADAELAVIDKMWRTFTKLS
jgi:hypothetical protein